MRTAIAKRYRGRRLALSTEERKLGFSRKSPSFLSGSLNSQRYPLYSGVPSTFPVDLLLSSRGSGRLSRSLFLISSAWIRFDAMIGRKLYKTKLCVLFQRGRCPRPSCNFAHGEAELRRFGGSFNGRRDHRNGDLRDKLDRRHSPYRRPSPGRDARAHHTFRHQKPVSRDRGSSLSRSPVRRRHRKKQHTDGESDVSESFKASDGPEDRKKGEKGSSYDDKDGLEEQLKQLQLDLEMLDDHKSQLELFLDEKVDEAHKLSSRIEDLESQLNREQEDCRRITSKIKKFIRAHGRYVKAQEELKRSQARLQKVGDQLSLDSLKPNANEDDPSINIVSDGEPNDDGKTSPRNNDYLSNLISTKKRPFDYPATGKDVKNGSSRKRERDSDVMVRSEKFSRFEGPAQSETISKGIEAMKAILNRSKSLVDDHKHKQGRSGSSSVASMDKGKGETRHSNALPVTGMAANAADEYAEAIEFDEKAEAIEATRVHENDDADYGIKSSYMPPPPPVTKNAYKQYEGDNEEVDVEKVDPEMLDIDINSEVDIEQV
ncbi:zinc finger CCCH domain-containing protein 13 [Canna indica]|uniref:Zinc finger CCCH domain-containing protein 13 n=1 Tax=Canna indica TaxID=4628 RepID=A0AAQ3L138_9LILI|nr:zinc finger CCCH domain-containing protein 13 [Canna indica]